MSFEVNNTASIIDEPRRAGHFSPTEYSALAKIYDHNSWKGNAIALLGHIDIPQQPVRILDSLSLIGRGTSDLIPIDT
jgi:hypothetical protein